MTDGDPSPDNSESGDKLVPKESTPPEPARPAQAAVEPGATFTLDRREHFQRFERFHFSSPYPPPELLAEYERAFPGTANRLFSMIEGETAYRRSQESKVLDAQIDDARASRREARLGQFLAFGLGAIAFLAGSAVAVWGSPTAGATIAVTGGLGIIAGFVARKNDARVETKVDEGSTDQKSVTSKSQSE